MTMKPIVLLVLLSLVTISGCSSSPSRPTSETERDKIIARIDDLGSRPSWVKEAEPFQIDSGHVISLGQTTIPGNNRVEAAYRIAQNNAKDAIAGAIEQRLSFVFQNAEEGTSLDATQARYIGAEASEITSNSIRPGKVYWEKLATTQDDGQRVTQYRVFSTVTMPEADFKRAILDAVRKAQGKGGLSASFAKKVESHWEKIAGAEVPKAETKTKEPASE